MLSSVKGCLVFSADRLLSFTWVGLMSLKGAGLSSVIGLWSVVVVKKRCWLLWLSFVEGWVVVVVQFRLLSFMEVGLLFFKDA